jgi:signal transduction histidine kinase
MELGSSGWVAEPVPRMSEGEQCFRELADALPDAVWIVRSDGRLLYGNSRWHALTPLADGDDFATAYLRLLHNDDRQRWIDAWETALRTRCAYEIERRLHSVQHGAYLRQVERARPVRDARGDVVEWVCIATSPFDRSQQLIEELGRSLVKKNEALIAVAHEMRSPLAPIASAVALLERRAGDPEFVADVRAMIGRQVRQLARLVEDLLALGRLDHRQLGMRKERMDLRRALAAAVETAQPIITARQHQLARAVLAEAAVIEGDEGRLTQVLVNLLVNAANYTDTGGRISISLEREGAAFVIRVRDTGIGIARDMLAQIFDPYVRVERSGGTGLGLGLTLARELVQLHGGTLTAHSEGIGMGSEFVLKLPAAGLQTTADAV